MLVRNYPHFREPSPVLTYMEMESSMSFISSFLTESLWDRCSCTLENRVFNVRNLSFHCLQECGCHCPLSAGMSSTQRCLLWYFSQFIWDTYDSDFQWRNVCGVSLCVYFMCILTPSRLAVTGPDCTGENCHIAYQVHSVLLAKRLKVPNTCLKVWAGAWAARSFLLWQRLSSLLAKVMTALFEKVVMVFSTFFFTIPGWRWG